MLNTDTATATPAVTFWVWWDDRWQGLRLTPEARTVHLHSSERTDEGWSSASEEYRLSDCGGFVECDVYTDGRDCDGRMATEWRGRCAVADLQAMPEDNHGPARPVWVELTRGQRDYSAEAAGY